MSAQTSTALVLMAVLCVCGAAGAAVQVETTVAADGVRLVRSLTPAAGEPEWPLAVASGQVTGQRSQDEYLWLDQNHQNAIAENVALSRDGAYGVAGWWLNSERTALYVVNDDNLPEWNYSMPVVDFQISVDADQTGARITSTGRNVPLLVFGASSSVPIQSHPYTAPFLGYYSAVSNTGNTYAAAAANPTADGEVRVYDGSGSLRFVDTLPTPPMGLSLSADGLVVAATVRTFVKIWDAMTGALRDSIPIPGETQAGAVLSGDGAYLVTGGFSRTVRLYEWNGGAYTQVWSSLIPATTWIVTLAIAEDGQTLAAGTWTSPSAGKVVLFDRASQTPLWTDAGYGDYIGALAFTPDGGLLAATSWGLLGGTLGNIVSVYERSSPVPLYGISDDAFPDVGSAFGVDISADGRYVLAGGKAVHARSMGHGGWLMCLELVDPADVADRRRPSMREPTLLQVTPNPSNGTARITLRAPGAGLPQCLQIVDREGRLVRTLQAAGAAAAPAWVWDGDDALGRSVSAGVYYVRLPGAADPDALRLLRLQ